MQPRSNKRQKELARQDRQREKEARREERKRLKSERQPSPEGGEDPDIAGIVPGPQPVPEEQG
jgi:hypothetical protein